MITPLQRKLNRFTFTPTESTMLPEESLQDLKMELLLVSRLYASTPFNSIHEFVVYGMDKENYVDRIYNKLYNTISYSVDVMLDKILNTYDV